MLPRPSQALPYLLAFVLGLGAAGLAACGGKTNPAMLPADNASELKNHLDDVLLAIESEDCGDATRAVAQVRSDLQSLPSGTSQRLQERLAEGADALEEQAAEECQETVSTETTTTVTETVPTVTTDTTLTETTPVETTPTVTTPPIETTPTETTPPVTTVPPDQTGGQEAP